jgi:threonine synthase
MGFKGQFLLPDSNREFIEEMQQKLANGDPTVPDHLKRHQHASNFPRPESGEETLEEYFPALFTGRLPKVMQPLKPKMIVPHSTISFFGQDPTEKLKSSRRGPTQAQKQFVSEILARN